MHVVDLKTGKGTPGKAELAEHAQLGTYQLAVPQGAIDRADADPRGRRRRAGDAAAGGRRRPEGAARRPPLTEADWLQRAAGEGGRAGSSPRASRRCRTTAATAATSVAPARRSPRAGRWSSEAGATLCDALLGVPVHRRSSSAAAHRAARAGADRRRRRVGQDHGDGGAGRLAGRQRRWSPPTGSSV